MVNIWGSGEMSQQNAISATPEPHLSELDRFKARISQSVDSLRNLVKAAAAPVPTSTGDGSYLPQVPSPSLAKDAATIFRDIGREDIKNIEDLAQVILSATLDRPLNDREYLMESLVAAAASLPDDVVQRKITDTFLTTLWSDLQHPPLQLLSDDYKYRQPDGSKNSYERPQVGAAGMPYARTVTPRVKQATQLPDPGVLFDTLLARKESTKHPTSLSSMLFYLASIIIHDIFRTDHEDFNKSKTSSYLDLAPLYGSNWEEQKRMRTLKDGKIKPDCFSETRLLTFPPGVGALLIMFNRYHNYVAAQLAAINEGGRFTENAKNPNVTRYGESINRRDDDLFQTARLVTCGLYVNIILIDYVRCILNLNRTDSNWQLNPRANIPNGPPVATGNQCAAEFNLVYRWHSAISKRDEQWTQQLFKELPLPADMKTPEAAAKPENIRRFIGILGMMEAATTKKDPLEREFPALAEERAQMQRISDGPLKGNFKDDDLAALLTAGIEDCANAFGPRQVPPVMKAIEILGIQQARTWKLATLNEFRKHFSLTPHETWADITEDVEVQETLKHLYDTPDQVELYPGLAIEDAKAPKLPGSGLCPSYTLSRSVLSDAVALVRGDRFYTESYTPASLTNWGFQEASSDLSIDNGCVFYKLFLRALPNNYDPSSVYVHYPMTVPDEMHRVLKGLGKDHLYNFDRPTTVPPTIIINSYESAVNILKDQDNFKVPWGKATEFLLGPPARNFMLAGDGPKNADSRKLMEPALYLGGNGRSLPKGNEKWVQHVRAFYEETATKLLKQKSYKLGSVNQVDIVRDVGNLAFTHFAAEMWSIPLKTDDFPHGIFSEQQLYLVLAAVFICVFFDLDPQKSFPLRQLAHEVTQQLTKLVEMQVDSIHRFGRPAEWLIEALKPTASPMRDYGAHMMAQLCKTGISVPDLVRGNIIPTAGGMVANQGQLFSQALDYFFTTGKHHLPEINRLAKLDTPEADDKLMHYFLEAARLNGEPGVIRDVAKPVTIADNTELLGAKTFNVKPGEKILINLRAVNHDPKVFPKPDEFNLNRPLDSYLIYGYGPHECMGKAMSMVTMATMLKVVGRLDNLRPAPVAVGNKTEDCRIKKVMKEFVPGDSAVIPENWHYNLYMTEDWDQYFPFPTSLKIQFDGEI